jgi:hypothetical protein
MLKREIVNLTSKEKTYVNFFEDDSIQTLREQAAKSVNSHPDRMFILVSLKLPKDHYTNDIRNWEDLFDRLSYHGDKIEKTLFDEYQKNYRFPNSTVRFEEYDRGQWMEFPETLKAIFAPDSIFSEYRTLGVKASRSYILEFSGEGVFAKKIPSAEIPKTEVSKLVESFYDIEDIDYSFIENLYHKKIPYELLKFDLMGHERKKFNNTFEGPVYDLDMDEYYDYNVDIKYFYDEEIQNKVYNFYRNDFLFFNHHGINY